MSNVSDFCKRRRIINRELGDVKYNKTEDTVDIGTQPVAEKVSPPTKIYLNSFDENFAEYKMCLLHVTTISYGCAVIGVLATLGALSCYINFVRRSTFMPADLDAYFSVGMPIICTIIGIFTHYKIARGIFKSKAKKLTFPMIVYAYTIAVEIFSLIWLWKIYVFDGLYRTEGTLEIVKITGIVLGVVAIQIFFHIAIYKSYVFLTDKRSHKIAVAKAERAKREKGLEIVYIGRFDEIPAEQAEILKRDEEYLKSRHQFAGFFQNH